MDGQVMVGDSGPWVFRKAVLDQRAAYVLTIKPHLRVSEKVEWQFCQRFVNFQTKSPFLPQLYIDVSHIGYEDLDVP